MAFVSPFFGEKSQATFTTYNIDFSVGAGVRGNLPTDIMLVQALFRIVHFEVKAPVQPPPGETGIDVDGRLGPATLRFILNLQRSAARIGLKTRVDGILDPTRSKKELSHIAKVVYSLEVLNDTASQKCEDEGIDNYTGLPKRTDIPDALIAELNLPLRRVAKQYKSEFR